MTNNNNRTSQTAIPLTKRGQRSFSILILGASSGIGLAVAQQFLAHGHRVGLAARRTAPLLKLQAQYPNQVFVQAIDVCHENGGILQLTEKMGGMDVYLHVAGIGTQNPLLNAEAETATAATNVLGFTHCLNVAFQYFTQRRSGHIAIISSIAGTKGLGIAPAYSASKAYQTTYLEALEQQANARHLPIHFTDIRPGFVRTPLLRGDNYPLLMSAEAVAKDVVDSILRQRHVRTIDFRYRLLVALWRCIPRCVWRRLRVGFQQQV